MTWWPRPRGNPLKSFAAIRLGHLSAGALADVAVLRLEKGQFAFVDSYGARMDGTERLANELTIASGRVVYDLNGRTRERWDRLGKYGPIGRSVMGRQQRSRASAPGDACKLAWGGLTPRTPLRIFRIQSRWPSTPSIIARSAVVTAEGWQFRITRPAKWSRQSRSARAWTAPVMTRPQATLSCPTPAAA